MPRWVRILAKLIFSQHKGEPEACGILLRIYQIPLLADEEIETGMILGEWRTGAMCSSEAAGGAMEPIAMLCIREKSM